MTGGRDADEGGQPGAQQRFPHSPVDGRAGCGLPPGTVLGKYRIIGTIGRGGMGVVYRAEHIDLGMLRALKTLAPEWADHPLARARFLKEAKAAARINHPHVVRIFDCGTHDGLPFFVMEHLEGEDLDAALTRTTLTVEQAAGIMLAVCAAISEMHREGLIHRDLKPGNIFLARDKVGNIVPTVLDFGIVKPSEPGPSASGVRTQGGVVVGTAHYVSPEQLADVPAGERSDQYALGVVLYQSVTGRLPFDGESTLSVFTRIASHHFPHPCEVRADLSPEFEEVILRAMSQHPSDRFPSVHDLGRALLPFASARHQSLWQEYYDRVLWPKAALSMPIPVAASSTWLPLPGGRIVTQPLSPGGSTLPLPLTDMEQHGRGGGTLPLLAGGTAALALPIGGTQHLPAPVENMPSPMPRFRRDAGSPSGWPVSDRQGERVQGQRLLSRSRTLALAVPLVGAIAIGFWLLWPSGPVRRPSAPQQMAPLFEMSAPTAPPAAPTLQVAPSAAVPHVAAATDLPPPSPHPEERAGSDAKKPRRLRAHRNSSGVRGDGTSAQDRRQHSIGEGTPASDGSQYPTVGDVSDSHYPAME